ncbi:siphovirus ReqiPepy6 Gp37-like family protein [Bacillus badius]|uniref:siphovirus ReqiPepy6 Gp37-like family protein n=1 Tax=Bacillus badius TaxID=1455 RepID=UPI001CBEE3F8|nr:siphovirus ReqiPepy6 Gp37-like family protein [Bacillus badius]
MGCRNEWQESVSGKTLGAIFNKRLILPNGDFDQIHDNVESILKRYVNQHIVNAIDKKCNTPSLKIAESKDQGNIIHVEGEIFDTKNGKIKLSYIKL